MTMIQLHYYPSTASMAPHILLEELGVPYERVLVDRTQDVHKTTAYLKLNPNGLIPVLSDGDLVLYETAAICLHLCDTHPAAGLAPPVGTPERAHFYKWLVWFTNTLQAALMIYFYPERWVRAHNTTGADEVRHMAHTQIHRMLRQVDTELARHAGPWMLGSTYTALDPYLFTLSRWTRHFDKGQARSLPHLGPYLERMLQRPAVQRVLANEGLSAPFV
jgi:glutathione S-transferase